MNSTVANLTALRKSVQTKRPQFVIWFGGFADNWAVCNFDEMQREKDGQPFVFAVAINGKLEHCNRKIEDFTSEASVSEMMPGKVIRES